MRRELYAHAFRLTKSEAATEDLVQDTVERALRFEDKFEPGTNARAWIHQILTNLFFTKCRQRRREGRALEVLTADPCAWTLPDGEGPVHAGLSRATRRALASLPEQFHDVLVLVDLVDLSYQATAERLGIPLGTVMSRLHRGRRLLADALRQEGTEQLKAA